MLLDLKELTLSLQKLTILLRVKDPKAKALRRKLLSSFISQKTMRETLDQQCKNKKQTNCYSCDDEGACSTLRGIAFLFLEKPKQALKEIGDALVHSRNTDDTWNSIVGLHLFGIAYETNNKRHQAILEYQQGLELLEIFCRDHENDYDEIDHALILKNGLLHRLENPFPPAKFIPLKKTITSASVKTKSRISFPWMSIYRGLQAGPNGPIWIDSLPENKGSLTDTIILDDIPQEIYSIKQGDNLITLTSERKYGWAKVSGDSMNTSKPIPILENDFVLFYESADADNNTIVIASYPKNSGAGYQYVIKRYAKNDKLLISETKPPERYDPMPLTSEVRILGVVIAVAKSEDVAEENKNQQEPDDAARNNNTLYAELLQLVQGNHPTADRLINHERTLSPQSSRDICIERAITRLLRDRKA